MTPTDSTPTPNPSTTSPRQWAKWLIIAGLALLALWLVYKTVRLVSLGLSLQSHVSTAESLLANGWREMDVDTAVQLTHDLRQDVVALNQEVAIFLPLTPYLTWLPRIGPIMPYADELLIMADGGTEAAVLLVDSLSPALRLLQEPAGTGGRIPQLVATIHNAAPEIAQARIALGRVQTAYAQIEVDETWPWRVQQLWPYGETYLPLAVEGLTVAEVLPILLGQQEPRTYLLVAQNEEELRASGGFISGAGLLTVADGQIGEVSFSDAYDVDDYRNKPYAFPPDPLYRFMGSELFLFRDSNFWADFPTTAEQAMALYSYGQDVPLDGVIAFDQRFLQLLVAAFGEVEVAELEMTLTEQNIQQALRQAWAEGDGAGAWVNTRKSFMGPMAQALRQKVDEDLSSLEPQAVLRLLAEGVGQKHVQVYVRDTAVAQALAEAGWDGRLNPVAGEDFLLVVDHNMGFNKSNALVTQSLSYAVDLGTNTAVVEISYTHAGATTPTGCLPEIPAYREGLQYDELVNRCFWNYQRLYVPSGSELLQASEHPVPAESLFAGGDWAGQAQVGTGEHGLTTFSNFFLLPQASTLTTSYEYRLPTVLTTGEQGAQTYVLNLPKQAGAKPYPVAISITLPPNHVLLAATPAPTRQEGQTVFFVLELAQDERVELVMSNE
jgi:hypothetical protein